VGYGYSGTELFIILTVYQNEATGELIWNIQKIAAQNQVFNSCERIPQYADMAKQMLEKIKRNHTNH
jgi:UTP:GlnB (protein PII) uridylyltransferase